MVYSEDLIEEIRARNDIVDVVSGYVKLQKKGAYHFGLCPFHNEKTPSFSVSGQKQMYHCFGCGEGGDVFSFVMKYENFTFTEAVKMLAARAGIPLPETEETEDRKRDMDMKSRLLKINKEAAIFFLRQLRSEKGKAAREYLASRELSEETIRNFGLGYAGKSGNLLYESLRKNYSDDLLKECGLFTFDERGVRDKFWNRVMFPIMDANSRVIGFGGRVMGDGTPKYLNSPETKVFDKSRNLYGLHAARKSRAGYMILCEGYLDVISMHQAGFTSAVASLGTAFTSGQASLLKRYTKEVLLIYDSDGAGIKAALRAIPILKEAGLSAKVVDLTPYKDPDEFIKAMGGDAFLQRLKSAQNSFLFEIKVLKRDYHMDDPESKTEFYRLVSEKLVSDFEDEMERNNYLEAVCREFMLPAEGIRRQVERIRLSYRGNSSAQTRTQGEPPREKTPHNSGGEKAQRLLLTWIADNPLVYPQLRRYISEEDFTNDLYRKTAGLLFEQMDGGEFMPARIVSHFEAEEDRKEVSAIFHTVLRGEMSTEEKEKALRDIVVKVRKNSLEEKRKHAVSSQELQQILAEQKNLGRIQITLKNRNGQGNSEC